MSTQEMFEKHHLKINEELGSIFNIFYVSTNENSEVLDIEFNNCAKTLLIEQDKDKWIEISISLFRAIVAQAKEIGWLDE